MKAAAESSDKEKTFELPDGSASAGEVPVQVAMVMYEMTDLQYRAVYNVLSFSPASMVATTLDVNVVLSERRKDTEPPLRE